MGEVKLHRGSTYTESTYEAWTRARIRTQLTMILEEEREDVMEEFMEEVVVEDTVEEETVVEDEMIVEAEEIISDEVINEQIEGLEEEEEEEKIEVTPEEVVAAVEMLEAFRRRVNMAKLWRSFSRNELQAAPTDRANNRVSQCLLHENCRISVKVPIYNGDVPM
ncbi:hypothetical protein R1flu_015366 [Riccia fluitans]|uniref:Uncharacterized protein n=1 Tax=Riccia fluitans TaxID=41844 RepID=A0ABD1YJ30_9MARC